MKRLLISALAAAGVAAAVTPALAQPLGSVRAREANIEQRIDQGVRRGDLTRSEASRLRAELGRIDRLNGYYHRSGGVSSWERRDLERRLDALSDKVFADRHDRQRR